MTTYKDADVFVPQPIATFTLGRNTYTVTDPLDLAYEDFLRVQTAEKELAKLAADDADGTRQIALVRTILVSVIPELTEDAARKLSIRDTATALAQVRAAVARVTAREAEQQGGDGPLAQTPAT